MLVARRRVVFWIQCFIRRPDCTSTKNREAPCHPAKLMKSTQHSPSLLCPSVQDTSATAHVRPPIRTHTCATTRVHLNSQPDRPFDIDRRRSCRRLVLQSSSSHSFLPLRRLPRDYADGSITPNSKGNRRHPTILKKQKRGNDDGGAACQRSQKARTGRSEKTNSKHEYRSHRIQVIQTTSPHCKGKRCQQRDAHIKKRRHARQPHLTWQRANIVRQSCMSMSGHKRGFPPARHRAATKLGWPLYRTGPLGCFTKASLVRIRIGRHPVEIRVSFDQKYECYLISSTFRTSLGSGGVQTPRHLR